MRYNNQKSSSKEEWRLKKLRRELNRSFYSNRNKGIPDLMLVIAIGNLIVWAISLMDPSYALIDLLYFDSKAILRGEIWRLFTYVFLSLSTNELGSMFLGMLALFFYYQLGNALEGYWGRLKFNCYYFVGILIQDLFLLILSGISGWPMYASASFVNMSLFLAYATINPDNRFLIFFIIPVKARWLALVDLGYLLYGMVQYLEFAFRLQYWVMTLWALYPLISLANFWLFVGGDIVNLFPLSWRVNASRLGKKRGGKARPAAYAGSGSFQSASRKQVAYLHKCTVCGKTDTEYPNLEFRYCSKCKGYYCYCEEHINQHIHIQ